MDDERTVQEDAESLMACVLRYWPEGVFALLVCFVPGILTAIVHPQTLVGILTCVSLFCLGGIALWFAMVLIGFNLAERHSKKK